MARTVGEGRLGSAKTARVALMCTLLSLAFLSVHANSRDLATDYVLIGESTTGNPQQAECLGRGFCYLKRLRCPRACPQRSSGAPGKSSCFIDCSKCQTSCKHRKPNCYGYGAVCYDPRFIGGDGVMFYFHGKKDHDFCLVSDRNLHINAHFIGKRPEGRSRDYTWVQSLGIIFDAHNLVVGATKVGTWEDGADYLYFSYEGLEFMIPPEEGALWTSKDGGVVVERTDAVNSVHVLVNQLMAVTMTVVPITERESTVHNYQITKEDCFAHLQMQFNFFKLSPAVNGVLGQTYQPGFKSGVKLGVPMPIMGGDDKYLSSSLTSTDCRVQHYTTKMDTAVDASTLQLLQPIRCSSSGSNGITCRR